jgi:hypothetical protein
MGGVCSTHTKWEEYVQNFRQKTRKEKKPLGRLDIDGKVPLKCGLRNMVGLDVFYLTFYNGQ